MENEVSNVQDIEDLLLEDKNPRLSPILNHAGNTLVNGYFGRNTDLWKKKAAIGKHGENSDDRQKLLVESFSSGGSKSTTTGPLQLDDENFLPGTQTIYMKTWGCSHNTSDSEYMSGLLVAAGYRITDRKEDANVWILNSCTVKTPSEQHFQNYIGGASSLKIPVVLAGCVPQAAPKTSWLQGISVVGVQQIDRIVEVVEETLKGNCVRLFSSRKSAGKRLAGAPLTLPKIRKNPLIEILPINTGCLNHCTYCKTKQARGDLASYSIEELVERARHSFRENVKEIWLTSEDLGAYGRDLEVTLPDLLFKLVEVIPDGCMMRLGMTNPPYILDHLEQVAEILNHPRVYAFLHIPVQSGSDAVLTDMRRQYTVKDFRTVVDYMLKNVPGIYIATDVICGFPTETGEDFEETLKLISEYRFPSLFINQFYPRPNTPAARMKRIDTVEVKRRTKLLTELFHSYLPFSHMVGSFCDVLVTEEASDGQSYVGHNKFYHQVLVPRKYALMGQIVKIKVSSVRKHCLIGEVVEEPVRRLFMMTKTWLPKYVLLAVSCLCLFLHFILSPFLLERKQIR